MQMFRWLRKKLAKSSEWRENHEASWKGFDIIRPNGETKFQADTLSQLKTEPSVSTVELVYGEKENYYKGTLSSNGTEFYLYTDEAEHSGEVYERWAFDSRQQLIEKFLANARKK